MYVLIIYLRKFTLTKMDFKMKKGFSLVEMMIVMLLIAVVLAASAPMITRKVSRERSDRVFDALSSDPTNAVEYIKGRGQRIFMNGRKDGYVGIVESGVTIPANSVLLGKNTVSNSSDGVAANLIGIGFDTKNELGSVAIGYRAAAKGDSVAIGRAAINEGNNTTSIGASALSQSFQSVAIGYNAKAQAKNSIAIGANSWTGLWNSSSAAVNSVAIGYGAYVATSAENSVAIGYNARADKRDNIVLGTESSTVYIPGNLIVDKISILGGKQGGYAILRENGKLAGKAQYQRLLFPVWSHAGFETDKLSGDNEESWNRHDRSIYFGLVDDGNVELGGHSISTQPGWYRGKKYYDAYKTGLSDRRLKNVGADFTAGLNELEQLNFYHYTFKDDKDQKPQVGVMAQDLQKVFPQAVTKNSEGWLQIRWDDMFYAAINAIKELNAKVCAIAKDVTALKATADEHTQALEAQAKTIEQQQAEIKALAERVEKLEHKNK